MPGRLFRFQMQVFYGETGFAGDNPHWVVPAVLVERQPVVLQRGDHVTIWDKGGQVLFAGPIIEVPEFVRVQVPRGNPRTFTLKAGEGVKHFLNLNRGQLGFPEWYRLFFDPEENVFTYNRYLRARVIRGVPGMEALYGKISQVYWTPPKLPRFGLKLGRTYYWVETGGSGWVVDGQKGPYDYYFLGEGDFFLVFTPGGLFFRFLIPKYKSGLFGPDWYPFFIKKEQWDSLFFRPQMIPAGTEVTRLVPSEEGFFLETVPLKEDTFVLGDDANLPALAFTFPPLTAIAKVLQRMLTGPPRR